MGFKSVNTCGSLSSRERVEVFNAGGFVEGKSVDPGPEEIRPASLHFQLSSEFLPNLHCSLVTL